jgi:hypothetical protein
MPRTALLPAAVAAFLLAADATAAPPRFGFAFGRTGGNIRPYTVRIANDGAVTTQGPVVVGRTLLTPAQIGRLNLKAVDIQFARLPTSRSCAGALPDVAYTFIRVGARTVRVRGTCLTGYTQLWHALARAVRLSNA